MKKNDIITQIIELTLQESDMKVKMEKIKAYLNENYWEYKKAARYLRDKHMKRTKSNRDLHSMYKEKYDKLESTKQKLILDNRGIL